MSSALDDSKFPYWELQMLYGVDGGPLEVHALKMRWGGLDDITRVLSEPFETLKFALLDNLTRRLYPEVCLSLSDLYAMSEEERLQHQKKVVEVQEALAGRVVLGEMSFRRLN